MLPFLIGLLQCLILLTLSLNAYGETNSVLDGGFKFQCSPLKSIGCDGLFPIRSNHDALIALLPEGEIALAMRIKTLQDAKKSIKIQTLIFTGDESGSYIAELLKEKKKQGVDVKIIVDAASNLDWQTQWMYYDLKQHGVEIEGYEAMYLEWINELSLNDPLYINKRHHEKLWIIDEDLSTGVAIMGGRNIANEYFRIGTKPAHKWSDMDVMVQGKIIKDMSLTFDRNFNFFKDVKTSRPDLFNSNNYWEKWKKVRTYRIPLITNKSIRETVKLQAQMNRDIKIHFVQAKARFFHNRPRFNETYIHQIYLNLIETAQKEIIIENAYFIPSKKIRNALKAAVTRGVVVKILTNSPATNDISQISAVSRYYYHELLSPSENAKLQIKEWEGDKYGQGVLHSKFAIFDKTRSVVGSYNLDPRSEFLNGETVIVFESPELGAQLYEQFLSDEAKSRLINYKEALHFKRPKNPFSFLQLHTSRLIEEWL